MSLEKKQPVKARLHSRNKNREQYDLNALIASNPELKDYLKPNKHGEDSVDFANPSAVKILNKALLNHYYGIKNWDFPDENLCPPIPGRADYIHHVADILSGNNFGKIPKGEKVTCLDVGVGANCIYPIIGVTEYDWNFIGSDIDPKSIASAEAIVNSNASLKDKVKCILKESPRTMFRGIIENEDKIDITICNPPFHSSTEEAKEGTKRKVKNLSGKSVKNPKLNFAGISNELICEGGEAQFIENMIIESKTISKNCFWFSTLVSKQSNLKGIYRTLEKMQALEVKTIPMSTGNKSSRIVAWSYLSKKDQKEWRDEKWEK
jgi:23S rRNA (adenine1618-N6)-methyltransferase